MLKEQPCQKKFELLDPWMKKIIGSIKKDLKNEHLKKDYSFMQKHFGKKNFDKLTLDEVIEAYKNSLMEGDEEISDKICNFWMLKNTEIYHFFAEVLTEVNPKFDEITAIPEKIERHLIQTSKDRFGAGAVYIFTIMNAVLFSESAIGELRSSALQELENEKNSIEEVKLESSEQMVKRLEGEFLKVSDKYEKKLLGLQKKYHQDTEGLKKQIAQLQRRLHEVQSGSAR